MRTKLGVAERLNLQGVLPGEGDFLQLTVRKDLLAKADLTQKEITDWEVKAVEGGGVKWSAEKAKEVEFDFTDAEAEYVRGQLEKLNNEKKLTTSNFSLYEIFVTSKDVKETPEEK